jgi:hypothetical protein
MQVQVQLQEEPVLGAGEVVVPGQRPALGALLIDAGIATEEQVEQAIAEVDATGERLGELVLRRGLATEAEVAALLARQWQLPFASADQLAVADGPVGEADELVRLGGVPVHLSDARPAIAIYDPHQARLDSIRTLLGEQTTFVVVAKSAYATLVKKWADMCRDGVTGVTDASAGTEPAMSPGPEAQSAAHRPAAEAEIEPEMDARTPSEREPAPPFDPAEAAREVEGLLSTLEQNAATIQVLRNRWREAIEALDEARSQLNQLQALQAKAAQHQQLAEELRRLVRDFAAD